MEETPSSVQQLASTARCAQLVLFGCEQGGLHQNLPKFGCDLNLVINEMYTVIIVFHCLLL